MADGRLVEWWRDASDLSLKVMNSLYKELYHSERPGWVRGDAIDAEKTLREMTELNERLRYLEEENKKLILENQEYKQTLSFRLPKLIVQIQGDYSGDYKGLYAELYKNVDSLRENEEGNIEIYMKSVYTNEIAAEFLPVSKSDFFGELRIHVTDQEINEYNASLPKEEVVQAYLMKELQKQQIYHSRWNFRKRFWCLISMMWTILKNRRNRKNPKA